MENMVTISRHNVCSSSPNFIQNVSSESQKPTEWAFFSQHSRLMTTHNWAFSRINKRQINVNCLGHAMTHHAATTIFNLGNKQISSVCLSFDSSIPAKINWKIQKNKTPPHCKNKSARTSASLKFTLGFSKNFSVEKLNCSSHIHFIFIKCINWQARGQVPVQSPKPQKAPKRARGIWPLG